MAKTGVKKPKKQKTHKPRKVRVLDKTFTSELDVKLYALNQSLAEPFMRNGKFSFRIAFDKLDGNNRLQVLSKSKCPVITIDPTDVLSTENGTAQRMLENFIAPNKTARAGQTRPTGHLFTDVTGTENQYDVDLDAIFATV